MKYASAAMPSQEPNNFLSTLTRQIAKRIKSGRDEKSPLTPEATVFLEVFLVAGCIWTFVKLAGKIRKGGTDEIDNEILLALRRPENPAIPIGPSWLPEMARDVTALGSGVDLTLASTTLVGYLCLNRRFRAAGYLIASVGSGLLLCRLLKDLFVRRRPTAVAPLTHFDPESFPSGHSMGSAIVYLTLGRSYFAAVRRMGHQGLFSFGGFTHHTAGRSEPTLSRCSLSERCAGGLGGRVALVQRLYAGGALAPAPRRG